MYKQTPLIHSKDWDVLVILDACRYDYFEFFYQKILGDIGILKKAVSPATWTRSWLEKTFNGVSMDDVVYVSSNPYILKFREHFNRVVNVWQLGFDEELGSVPPEETNKHTLIAMELYRDKRFIIHYMPPHDPYLFYKNENFKWVKNRLFQHIRKIIYEIISDETVWTVMKKLGFPPESYLAAVWFKYGRDGIVKGYVEDLKLVLRYVKEIIDRFPDKKFVITADHGERLGEKKRYSHGSRHDEFVTIVPWFEINRR